MIFGAIVIFGLTWWLLKGYIEHERFYYQSLVLEYMDRKGYPSMTDEDWEESRKELDKRKWINLKFFILEYRWPLKYIRFTKEFWIRVIKEFRQKVFQKQTSIL